MQARQFDRKQYFDEQAFTTEKYVIPYINELMPVTAALKVAEIGCGEGGNLKPFLDKGCTVVGIDLSDWKIAEGLKFYEDHPLKANLKLINKNIYDVNDDPDLKFDLIIMRDTIEHIPNQDLFLEHLKPFLKPGGKVFFAFPVWCMPFGGHQQMCTNKFLSTLPWFHILPKFMYRFILKSFGETDSLIEALMEIKDTRLSIFQFKKILAHRNYKIDKQTYYLINPNYEVKFKLKPRILPWFLNIPYLRDFIVTAMYAVASLE